VGASSTKSFAAESYAVNVKLAKYSHALTDSSLMLTAIVAETFGAWNKASCDFIADLSRWLAARDPSKCRYVESVTWERIDTLPLEYLQYINFFVGRRSGFKSFNF
jgi:hypothetical protein